jgi:hypothetical protein
MKVAASVEGGFLEVISDDCSGYVRSRCLEGAEVDGRVLPGRRFFYWGLAGGVGGAWAKIPSSPALSAGLDWGVAALVTFRGTGALRWMLIPSYQTLVLQRTVVGTGALSDPGTVYTHTGQYAGLGTLLTIARTGDEDTEFGLDIGAHYLYPLSVIQTSSLGTSATVQNSGALVLGVLGPSVFAFLSSSVSMIGATHLTYNFAGGGRFHLFSARLTLGLVFA